MDRERLLSTIAVLFGGRIAEEIFMHQMTTGASNDFERATEMARRMVTQWGMSDALGPMVYGENEGEVFLGRSVTTHKNVSEVDHAEGRSARSAASSTSSTRWRARLIEENKDKVEAMTKALLEWETMDSDQIERHHGRQAAARAQAEAVRDYAAATAAEGRRHRRCRAYWLPDAGQSGYEAAPAR